MTNITSGMRLTPARLDRLDDMPDPAANFGNGTNTITATAATWAVLPTTTADAVITNPSSTRDLLVQVSYSAWMIGNGSSVRATVGATGGLTIPGGIGVGGALGWGEILYQVAGSASSFQKHASYTCKIPAGASAVTFLWYAYRDTASTANVNYPVTRLTPIRYI